MRRIVIAKMLILALWSLYLGIALSQPSENENTPQAGSDPITKRVPRLRPTKFRQREAAYFCPAASMIRFPIVSRIAGLLEDVVGI